MMYNLKIAFRNLFRNKLYFFINAAGLALSLVVCAFILLWIHDERGYDRFHKDAENIYMVVAHFDFDGDKSSSEASSGLFGPVARQYYSEVTAYCRLRAEPVGYLQAGGVKTGEKQMLLSDSTFFSFFNFAVVKGQTQGLLEQPDDVIISESLSRELFGEEDPIGKVVLAENHPLNVVAVMKDFPDNTSIPRADIICSYKTAKGAQYTYWLNTWQGCEFETYLRLQPGTDIGQLAQSVTQRQTVLQKERSFTLQPLLDRHLYTLEGEPGLIKSVWIFQWIVAVLLCIACINCVNLITARSSRRQQEVALKKMLGARKWRLFSQLFLETVILFIIAVAAAALLNTFLWPAFNKLAGKDMMLDWLSPLTWSVYGLMLLVLIVLSGIYPAWLLASFKPVNLMQKIQGKKGGKSFRNALVIVQFVISTILVVVTITLELQLRYVQQKDLGFNKEGVLRCNLHNMAGQFEAIRNVLEQCPAVQGITNGNQNIMSVTSSTFANWEGKTGTGDFSVHQYRVDTAFVNVMQMSLVDGKNFTSKTQRQVILNETAVKSMGIKDPVGKWIEIGEFRGERGVIAGVVKDFHFNDFYEKITPLMMYYERPNNWYSQLFVRTVPGGEKEAIAALENLWKQYNGDYVFNYSFLDREIDRIYKAEIRTGRVFSIFSIIAVLVSCLGLFGLVTFTTETKTKEIGIRKVLGATIGGIVNMLTKEFLILVIIAMFIAFPVAYYWLERMLQDYAYRVPVTWWIFGLAAIITLLLTFLTVSWKALKAAIANPVESIKTE